MLKFIFYGYTSAYTFVICSIKINQSINSYGRIAKIAAQFSHGLVNSAMGQIHVPCSTERISCYSCKQSTMSIWV